MPKLKKLKLRDGFGGKGSLTLRNLPQLGCSFRSLEIINSCNEMEKVTIESERWR